jgi:hypothetical protein
MDTFKHLVRDNGLLQRMEYGLEEHPHFLLKKTVPLVQIPRTLMDIVV